MSSKCLICIKTIAKNHRFIHCQTCKANVHIKCNRTDINTFNKITEENLPQFCINCKPDRNCGICRKQISVNQKKLQCKKCCYGVHIKCNEIDNKTYDKIINDEMPIICIKCQPNNFPFMNLTDPEFYATNNNTPAKTNEPKIKCAICTKTIVKNHRKIECNQCCSHVHIKCNQTDIETYNKLINLNLPQFCIKCKENTSPPVKEKMKCNICAKTIAKNHRKLQCHICDENIHIKCNKTDIKSYNNLKKDNATIFCLKCQIENVPFQNLTDLQFCAVNKGLDTDTEVLQQISVTSSSLRSFFNEVNKSNPFDNSDPDGDEDDTSGINCKYYDLNEFNYKPKGKTFSLIHTNIGSLAKHKEELETILDMLDYKFDVIGISETKLNKNKKPKFNIEIKGYHCYHTDTEAEKGGSLLYISDTLKCKKRPDLESMLYKSEVLESTFVEIINPNKKNTVIGCIYRHPSMGLEEFNTDYMSPFFEALDKENKSKYLIGDYNVDLLKIDSDLETSNFFDTITSSLMVPHITLPTRITPTSKTLIDNIFSNSPNFKDGISGNLTVSLSDHLAQFLIISDESHHSTSKQHLFTRDYKNFDKNGFMCELQQIQWPTILKLHTNDPNVGFTSLQKSIDQLLEKYLPVRKMTKKEVKRKEKPWITNEILSLIRQREKFHKKFIKEKDQSKKNIFHEQYRTFRNQIVTASRQSKKLYFQKYFEENSLNLRNTWRGIKSIININHKGKSKPTSLIIGDELITDPYIVADEFNNYFSSIAGKLQNSIHTQGQNFNDYLQVKCDQTFFLKATHKYEVIDIITSSISNKAVGPNSIPNKILHMIKELIAEPLAEIINLSFSTGIYIDKLKISKIIPIYKEKGSNTSCKNFRPISLLSNINKIIEKIMHQRLYDFLEKQGSIYDYQFGFRKSHSTDHALLDLTEDIRQAIDKNNFACGIFIDLQKAFDTVDHDILLKKLEHYGIRGISNDWFRSYLKNRKQLVSISGVESHLANMDFGVPQGSVLGPLLFLIYINDLHNAIKFCTTRHFADDTNLLIYNKSLKQLQKDLNYDLRLLCRWLKANKISLNCGKTELIIFRHPNKQVNYKLKIKINGTKLIPSHQVKYLGIVLDPHLNWSHHTNGLASKLTRAAGMLAKIRHFVPKNTLRSIYFGIFSSLLTYGSQIWGQYSNQHIKRLQKIQNKAIRIINFSNYNDSVDPLYYKSKILKLSDHVRLKNFLFVHNSLNNNLPSPLKNSFKLNTENHSHTTRSTFQNKMALPEARTLIYGLNSIKYRSVAEWNLMVNDSILENLHLKSISVCKKTITNYLIDEYEPTS